MKRRIKCNAITRIGLASLLLLVLLGCDFIDTEDPVSSSWGDGSSTVQERATAPNFRIMSRESGMTDYGRPKVTIIVKNTGTETGYNVSCDVQAKKVDTIMDSGFAYFANGGDIDPGEKAQADAIFFDLTTLDGYKLEYDLTWLEHR